VFCTDQLTTYLRGHAERVLGIIVAVRFCSKVLNTANNEAVYILLWFFKYPNQYKIPGLLHPFKSQTPTIDLDRLMGTMRNVLQNQIRLYVPRCAFAVL
jgi:hypothetical protein